MHLNKYVRASSEVRTVKQRNPCNKDSCSQRACVCVCEWAGCFILDWNMSILEIAPRCTALHRFKSCFAGINAMVVLVNFWFTPVHLANRTLHGSHLRKFAFRVNEMERDGNYILRQLEVTKVWLSQLKMQKSKLRRHADDLLVLLLAFGHVLPASQSELCNVSSAI